MLIFNSYVQLPEGTGNVMANLAQWNTKPHPVPSTTACSVLSMWAPACTRGMAGVAGMAQAVPAVPAEPKCLPLEHSLSWYLRETPQGKHSFHCKFLGFPLDLVFNHWGPYQFFCELGSRVSLWSILSMTKIDMSIYVYLHYYVTMYVNDI